MRSVKDEIKGLTPRPDLGSCLLRQVEEQVGSVTKDLSYRAQDILPSKEEEECLLDTKVTLGKALFELSVQIKCLLRDLPSNPSMPESENRVKLLKIDVLMLSQKLLRPTLPYTLRAHPRHPRCPFCKRRQWQGSASQV